MQRNKVWIIWISGLIVVAILSIFVSIRLGSVDISTKNILQIINDRLNGESCLSPETTILFKIRIPRVLLGFIIGGALSLAGVIFQGMFKNPLVEPYTLGVSGSAALMVSIAIICGLSIQFVLAIAGSIGALIAIFLVYFIGARVAGMKMTRFLLIGVMISFICSSLVMLIMSIAKAEEAHSIIFWIMGSLDISSTNLVKFAFLIILFGGFLTFLRAWDLNALSLGEEEAQHLGINVKNTKRFLFIIASLLTGVSVSLSGIIGFVGLVVPHFARILIGNDHRILIPSCFLLGGVFLTICDTIARTVIAPVELPVGVVTGIIGGVAFLCFLSKRIKS